MDLMSIDIDLVMQDLIEDGLMVYWIYKWQDVSGMLQSPTRNVYDK